VFGMAHPSPGSSGGTVDRRAWRILAATSLTNFLVGLDLSITNVAVPDMRREFTNASTADVSWVLTFYLDD
jgi:MFS family permease